MVNRLVFTYFHIQFGFFFWREILRVKIFLRFKFYRCFQFFGADQISQLPVSGCKKFFQVFFIQWSQITIHVNLLDVQFFPQLPRFSCIQQYVPFYCRFIGFNRSICFNHHGASIRKVSFFLPTQQLLPVFTPQNALNKTSTLFLSATRTSRLASAHHGPLQTFSHGKL